MADLKIKRLDSVPASLDHRAIIAVGTGDDLTFYIGNSSNSPILLGGGAGLSGVTMVDQWRLTTSFTGSATPIAANWEQADTNNFSNIGSAMAQSSGVFTFPSTGVYLIRARGIFNFEGSTARTTTQLDYTPDNGSTWNTASIGRGHISQIGTLATQAMSTAEFITDVTDLTTQKVRLSIDVEDANTTTVGVTGFNQTAITFIRLGDT